MTTLPTPTHARNMRLIGHSDQGGREDGVQIMVHRGFAYIGHIFSKGFSVLDVSDPTKIKPVNYVASPFNTWNLHLQTYEDLLLVVHAKDMFAQPELEDEKNYYKGKADFHAKEAVAYLEARADIRFPDASAFRTIAWGTVSPIRSRSARIARLLTLTMR